MSLTAITPSLPRNIGVTCGYAAVRVVQIDMLRAERTLGLLQGGDDI